MGEKDRALKASKDIQAKPAKIGIMVNKCADKADIAQRVDALRLMKAASETRSSCYAFAAKEWGIAARTTDVYIAKANQQIVDDFSCERSEYTAQLLSVLHRVMTEGIKTNQMGAVTAAVAQAVKLARLDR